jgi:hypothetical protein
MVGETKNLSWFTLSHETHNISLVQEVVPSENDGVKTIYEPSSIEDVTSFVWTVDIQSLGFDLSASNIFFFWVNIYMPDAAASEYFNIADSQSASASGATTILPATTSPSATALSSRAPISTTQSPTSSSSPSPASNGLSIDGKESLGIALGLGIPAIIGILAIVFVLLKRKKRVENQTQHIPYTYQLAEPPVEANGDIPHRAEKPGDRNSRAELPAI